MDRVYQSNAIETPPSSVASSGSYPTAGNKASGQLATVPGPYWFYSITEEIRNAIIAAGLTPDSSKVNQLAESLSKFLPLSGGTMTGAIRFVDGNAIYQTTDFSGINVYGGSDTWKGGGLQLFGMSCEGNNGCFQVYANDGSKSSALRGEPDGKLTWGGKHVAMSEKWVAKYQLLSSITKIGIYTLDLSGYLPTDDDYEVLVKIYVYRDDSSGTNTNVSIHYAGDFYMTAIIDGSNWNNTTVNGTVPLNRKNGLVYEISKYAPDECTVELYGYKKVS